MEIKDFALEQEETDFVTLDSKKYEKPKPEPLVTMKAQNPPKKAAAKKTKKKKASITAEA